MIGLRLETKGEIIEPYDLIRELAAGKSTVRSEDCDLFTHAACHFAAFCGICEDAHSDAARFSLAMEERGFNKRMIYSSENPQEVTAIEMVSPDGSGSIKLDIRQTWLRPGTDRYWLRQPTEEGMLIGVSTISVHPSLTPEDREAAQNSDDKSTSPTMLFDLRSIFSLPGSGLLATNLLKQDQ